MFIGAILVTIDAEQRQQRAVAVAQPAFAVDDSAGFGRRIQRLRLGGQLLLACMGCEIAGDVTRGEHPAGAARIGRGDAPQLEPRFELEHLRGRDKAMQYLARRVAKEYGLPQDVALSAVDMSMAMTEAAAQHLSQSHDDVDFATDICVTLLLGGLDALAKRHAKAQAAAARAAKKAKDARVAKGAVRSARG